MPRLCLPMGLMLVVLVAPTALRAEDEPRSPDKSISGDRNSAAEKLVSGGSLTGKLTSWDGPDKPFKIAVELQYGVPNASAVRTLANLQVKLARARSAQEALSLRRQIAVQQTKLVTLKKETHTLECVADKQLKVRLANPPQQFDEKGRLRKYTQRELNELRGPDRKLPGYQGELADVHGSTLVTAYFAKKPLPKAKDKEAAELLKEYKPEVVMLVILGEAPK